MTNEKMIEVSDKTLSLVLKKNCIQIDFLVKVQILVHLSEVGFETFGTGKNSCIAFCNLF